MKVAFLHLDLGIGMLAPFLFLKLSSKESFLLVHTLVSSLSFISSLFSFFNPKGGAENLVVNAAAALVKRGDDVVIYTTHHDPNHCFAEATGDGF